MKKVININDNSRGVAIQLNEKNLTIDHETDSIILSKELHLFLCELSGFKIKLLSNKCYELSVNDLKQIIKTAYSKREILIETPSVKVQTKDVYGMRIVKYDDNYYTIINNQDFIHDFKFITIDDDKSTFTKYEHENTNWKFDVKIQEKQNEIDDLINSKVCYKLTQCIKCHNDQHYNISFLIKLNEFIKKEFIKIGKDYKGVNIGGVGLGLTLFGFNKEGDPALGEYKVQTVEYETENIFLNDLQKMYDENSHIIHLMNIDYYGVPNMNRGGLIVNMILVSIYKSKK